jgi:hypothetical protein
MKEVLRFSFDARSQSLTRLDIVDIDSIVVRGTVDQHLEVLPI